MLSEVQMLIYQLSYGMLDIYQYTLSAKPTSYSAINTYLLKIGRLYCLNIETIYCMSTGMWWKDVHL